MVGGTQSYGKEPTHARGGCASFTQTGWDMYQELTCCDVTQLNITPPCSPKRGFKVAQFSWISVTKLAFFPCVWAYWSLYMPNNGEKGKLTKLGSLSAFSFQTKKLLETCNCKRNIASYWIYTNLNKIQMFWALKNYFPLFTQSSVMPLDVNRDAS